MGEDILDDNLVEASSKGGEDRSADSTPYRFRDSGDVEGSNGDESGPDVLENPDTASGTTVPGKTKVEEWGSRW
jgi:hypothetical protein